MAMNARMWTKENTAKKARKRGLRVAATVTLRPNNSRIVTG